MIPFQKIFTLLIRTFSRPMLQYFKQKQQLKQSSIIGRLFIAIGRRTYAIEHWVNLRILKTLTLRRHILYTEEVLLQKGVQTFYELLFYMIVLGVPFWQLYKGSLSAVQKQKTLQRRMINLDKKLDLVNNKIDRLHKSIVQKNKLRQTKKLQEINVSGQVQQNKSAQSVLSLGANQNEKTGEETAVEVEEILENAVEVLADEFEDILDQISFSEENGALQIDNITEADIQVQEPIDIDSEVNDPLQADQFDSADLAESFDSGAIQVEIEVDSSTLSDNVEAV